MQQHIKNDMLYLLRILEAAKKVQLYTSSFTDWESFYFSNDQLEFNACLNQLVQKHPLKNTQPHYRAHKW